MYYKIKQLCVKLAIYKSSPDMYRRSDLGFWCCHMLTLLTKLNAVGRECWIFATCAWQSKWLSFRYVFLLWIYSGNLFVDWFATCAWQSKWLSFRYVFLLWIYSGNLFVDCMKISFFISIFSSLQMTNAAVQHTKWCLFCLYFIHYKLFCGCIYVATCWTTCVRKLLYSNCIDLSLARGR